MPPPARARLVRDARGHAVLVVAECLFALAAIYAGWQFLAGEGALAGKRWIGNAAARAAARERMADAMGLSARLYYDDLAGRIGGQVSPLPWEIEPSFLRSLPEQLPELDSEDEYALAPPLFRPDPPSVRRVFVHLRHPVRRDLDVNIVVPFHADGSFSITLPRLAPARWQAVLEDEGGLWRLAAVWDWPRKEEIALGAGKEK